MAGGIALSACSLVDTREAQTPPPTRLLRGGNLTVDATPWAGLWAEWNWNDWVKWQVDRLAALTGNAVRLIGGIGGITDGLYTLQQYLARWEQFLDYTASMGLNAYPCGGGLAHWSHTNDQQAQDIYRAWGTLLDRYDHVIGIDVTNEAFYEGVIARGLSEARVFTTLEALSSTLREVTTKPIGHSQVVESPKDLASPRNPRLRGISDFADFHVYYTPTSPEEVLGYVNAYWPDQPVIVGEIGVNTTASPAERTGRYRAARRIVEADKRFLGAFSWAVTDTVPNDPPSEFGLVDRAGVERSDIVRAFRNWPTVRR